MKGVYTYYKNWKIHKIMKKKKVFVIPPHQDNHFYVIILVSFTVGTRK